jgi:hypothetical protein
LHSEPFPPKENHNVELLQFDDNHDHICYRFAQVRIFGRKSNVFKSLQSCSKSSGRFSRHTEINSIINRSLTSIHVNSTLEPNGLSQDDGKRPDGITLVPWIKGQPLVWDVTVVDTLADSYVLKTSEVSGFAAEMACKRKHSTYSSIISSNYIFKGLAFETLGAKKPSISLMSPETGLSPIQEIQN